VLKAACSKLQELVIKVQLPDRTIQLPVCPAQDCAYQLDGIDQLAAVSVTGETVIGRNITSEDEVQDIRQQVAAQTAALLLVAHVLHLQPLVDAVHRFIRLSTWSQMSIFAGHLPEVFPDAVVEAALGSSTVSREAYISSVLTQPCSLVDTRLSSQGLFQPVGKFIDAFTGTVTVQAHMLRDFAGAKAGQQANVTLDLFNEDGLQYWPLGCIWQTKSHHLTSGLLLACCWATTYVMMGS
jgi:hypothetical protein